MALLLVVLGICMDSHNFFRGKCMDSHNLGCNSGLLAKMLLRRIDTLTNNQRSASLARNVGPPRVVRRSPVAQWQGELTNN